MAMSPGSLRISPVFRYPPRAILENDTSRSELAQKGFVMRHHARWVLLLTLIPSLALMFSAHETAATGGQTPQSQQAVQRASSLLQQNQAAEALEELDRAIEQDPSFAMAYYIRGMALGNLGREEEAQQAFLEAALYNPGWTEAHYYAALSSFRLGDYDTCWEQTILAHQAGKDLTAEIADLSNSAPPPDDLEARLNAPRVYVQEADLSSLEETRTAEQTIAFSAPYLQELAHQARRGIQDSHYFGLVPRPDMADYVFVIEVEDLGGAAFAEMEDWRREEDQDALPLEESANQPIEMDAYLKLLAGEEQAYRRQMRVRDIRTASQISAELSRQIGYLESWLEEQR
jgi:tetratricopeptide (TPR) repeat protein